MIDHSNILPTGSINQFRIFTHFFFKFKQFLQFILFVCWSDCWSILIYKSFRSSSQLEQDSCICNLHFTRHFTKIRYSSVPNRPACTFINFEEKIPPARPYLGLHVYWFWENNPPCTFIWVQSKFKIKSSKLKTAYKLVKKSKLW